MTKTVGYWQKWQRAGAGESRYE